MKIPQEESKKIFTYDLSDSEDKAMVLNFERELGEMDFKEYCYQKGYLIKNKKYPEGAVVYSTLALYNNAREMMKALDSLRESRYEAEKDEHLSNLSLTGDKQCQPHSYNLNRCVYCWPWGFKDWCIAHKKFDLLDKLNQVYDKMSFPEEAVKERERVETEEEIETQKLLSEISF